MRCCLLAMLLAGPVMATDPILRCVAADGHVTFTQRVCPDGTRLTGTHAVELDPRARPKSAAPPAAEPARVVQRTSFAPVRTARVPDARDRQRMHCQDVREDVDRDRKRDGGSANYDRIRAWDDRVQAACKGL